jgi:hypothetical protein
MSGGLLTWIQGETYLQMDSSFLSKDEMVEIAKTVSEKHRTLIPGVLTSLESGISSNSAAQFRAELRFPRKKDSSSCTPNNKKIRTNSISNHRSDFSLDITLLK